MEKQEKIIHKISPMELAIPVELLVRQFCGNIRVGWWSAGITSAVACKIALELYDNVELFYIETGQANPDNLRFKRECEEWYGKSIHHVKNKNGYESPIDVVLKTGYMNGPNGARCSTELKKMVRLDLEEAMQPNLFDKRGTILNQIFGFEWEQKQVNRAIRFLQQFPEALALFPLIERMMNKNHCAGLLLNAGIDLPARYKEGQPNNNCEVCLKAGEGSLALDKKNHPETFWKTASAERIVGHSCLKNKFLDEIKEGGRKPKEVMPQCGVFCEIQYADIPVFNIEDVMKGRLTIYEAAMQATKSA